MMLGDVRTWLILSDMSAGMNVIPFLQWCSPVCEVVMILIFLEMKFPETNRKLTETKLQLVAFFGLCVDGPQYLLYNSSKWCQLKKYFC